MEGDPNVGSSSSSAIKKRKRISKVWNEMRELHRDGDGNVTVECIYCKKTFDGSSKKGTTHLKNHLDRCRANPKRKGPGGRDGDDQDQSLSPSIKTKELASLIKEKSLRGLIKHFSNSEESDCDDLLQLYQEEKDKLCQFLNKLSCRYSLGLARYDFGIGDDNFGYCLVVYYIDDSWKRQIKIISFWKDPPDLKNSVEALKNWKIDRNKCCALLLPDQIRPPDHGDNQIGKTESWFSPQGSLSFAGFIHDLESFWDYIDGILFSEGYFRDGIQSLMECAEYVYKSISDKLIQLDLFEELQIFELKRGFSKSFIRYFRSAVALKEVFFVLDQSDSDFRSINLTKQKWDEVTATFEHLKLLEDWVREKCDIPIIVDLPYVHKILKDRCNHQVENCFFCQKVMKELIEKYFSKYCLVIVMKIMLDPRFKVDGVQLCCKEIYGSDADRYIEIVNKDFRDVYDEYAATDSSNSQSYEMRDAMGRPSPPKSEFDLYMQELKIPATEAFDILAWWRGNAASYPTLARMARDYLAAEILFADTVVDLDLLDMMDVISCSGLDEKCSDEILSPMVCLKGFFSTAKKYFI